MHVFFFLLNISIMFQITSKSLVVMGALWSSVWKRGRGGGGEVREIKRGVGVVMGGRRSIRG